MTGKEFEDIVEEILIKYGKTYKREGTRRTYGHRASKGKFDFELQENAIECKVCRNLNDLTIRGLNKKTGKPYTNTDIKPHQLRALRQFSGTGYILIHDDNKNRSYALTMRDFDMFVIENDVPRTMNNIDKFEINLDQFLKGVN